MLYKFGLDAVLAESASFDSENQYVTIEARAVDISHSANAPGMRMSRLSLLRNTDDPRDSRAASISP